MAVVSFILYDTFFFYILYDGRGFFQEGNAAVYRHGRRSNGYSQSAIATEIFV
jgi:hypothetical protein